MSTPEAAAPGPCVPWITADDLSGCESLTVSGDVDYDDYVTMAVAELFEASGRQFAGECGPRLVRPCEFGPVCSPRSPCGCCELSFVVLSGYPVRSIEEVKIDGEVVDPSEYRLDARHMLVRLADEDGRRQAWPGCQRLDLDDTEEGTFSVSYTYGQDPPVLAQQAAIELACQLAAFGPDGSGDCELPDGTVRVTRQGITIDLEAFIQAGSNALPFVSSFLRAYNRSGLRRRSAIWSPDLPPYARSVG